MLQHLKGYHKSITLIKTGRLNKQNNTLGWITWINYVYVCFMSDLVKF